MVWMVDGRHWALLLNINQYNVPAEIRSPAEFYTKCTFNSSSYFSLFRLCWHTRVRTLKKCPAYCDVVNVDDELS
jgi:hypothetical protein